MSLPAPTLRALAGAILVVLLSPAIHASDDTDPQRAPRDNSTTLSGIQRSSNKAQARTSVERPPMRSSPARRPWRSRAFRSFMRARNVAPTFTVFGGASRRKASWMLYSSVKRSTAGRRAR